MFAAALLLPYRNFIPMLWLCSFIGYGIIVYYLASILLVSRSRIALWFAASLVVTAIAGFAEVSRPCFGLPGPMPYVNSVTAALSSGLLVAMALAEQMRIERSGRQGAEHRPAENLRPGAGGLLHGRRQRPHPARQSGPGAPARPPGVLEGNTALAGLLRARHLGIAARPVGRQLARATSLPVADHGAWYEARASIGDGLIEGSIEDITEAITANRKLMYLADHDQLTGTLSRRAIEQALRGAINSAGAVTSRALWPTWTSTASRPSTTCSGTPPATKCCANCAPSMVKSLGNEHLLGRIGGDEFLILLRGMSLADATDKCHELVKVIDGDIFPGPGPGLPHRRLLRRGRGHIRASRWST
jgi:hypothetical protein